MHKSDNPIAVRSRGLITGALLALLEERPYRAITVTHLCARAQVGRKTFYRNYSEKDEVMEDYFDVLCRGFLEAMDQMGPYSHHAFALAIFSYWRTYVPFLQRLEAQGEFGFFLRRFDSLVPLMGRYFPPEGGCSFGQYCQVYHAGGCKQMLWAWIQGGGAESPEEMARYYAEIQTGGREENNLGG